MPTLRRSTIQRDCSLRKVIEPTYVYKLNKRSKLTEPFISSVKNNMIFESLQVKTDNSISNGAFVVINGCIDGNEITDCDDNSRLKNGIQHYFSKMDVMSDENKENVCEAQCGPDASKQPHELNNSKDVKPNPSDDTGGTYSFQSNPTTTVDSNCLNSICTKPLESSCYVAAPTKSADAENHSLTSMFNEQSSKSRKRFANEPLLKSNVHQLIDSFAGAGVELNRNNGFVSSTALSSIATFFPFELRSTRPSGRVVKNECVTAIDLKSRGVQKGVRKRINHSQIVNPSESPREGSSRISANDERHPFLYHWESDEERLFNKSWAARRKVYTGFRLIVDDLSINSSSCDSKRPSSGKQRSNRLSEKRYSSHKHKSLTHSYVDSDQKLVVSKMDDDTMCNIEPNVLGYRWILLDDSNDQRSSTTNQSFKKRDYMNTLSTNCETMLFWK